MSGVKAFELSSVIERVTLGEKIRVQIECVDYCGKKLYIGTSDSFVIEFSCENGRRTAKQSHYRYLGLKKPVITIKAIFILERILCICDSNLLMLSQNDLEPVSYGSKLKNVNCFCLNENPSSSNPFSVEICVAVKKQILICDLNSEKLIVLREVSISKPALALAMDGAYVCVGTESEFFVVDWESSHIQDLCACDSDVVLPITKRVGKEEFLISGPGSLGLFVKATGTSDKPPLQWGPELIAIAFSRPYILCLNDVCLSVYSIGDQQLKQRIPFVGGTFLENFDGNIFIASEDSIFALVPVPWEKQVQSLLADKKVKEALELSQNWHQAGVTTEVFNKYIKQIKQQAGFVEFLQKNFAEAKNLFFEGSLDVRELLCLFPQISPELRDFKSDKKHVVDGINQIDQNSDSFHDYYLFLYEFLEDLKFFDSDQYKDHKENVDTALVTLCCQQNSLSQNLLEIIKEEDLQLRTEWVVEQLISHSHYHVLAILYSKTKASYEKAIQTWIKLETLELKDPSYPGINCITDFMEKIDDDNLIMKYIDFIFDRDEELGTLVLISRKKQSQTFDHEAVIKHLQRYPLGEVKFLEFLVFDCDMQKEKFHTHLALIYVNNVIKLKNSNASQTQIEEAHKKLRNFLRLSSLYRVQMILGKALDANLLEESAILYGKIGEHQKALKILVEQVKNFKLAEEYCIDVSSQEVEPKQRNQIFHALLGLYLDLSEKSHSELVKPAIQLLNSEVSEFDTIKILESIPKSWSIDMIKQFIIKSLRRSMHQKRISIISKALFSISHSNIRLEKFQTERKSLFISADRICNICKGNITEAEFIWYPTLGIVLHPYCGRKL